MTQQYEYIQCGSGGGTRRLETDNCVLFSSILQFLEMKAVKT